MCEAHIRWMIRKDIPEVMEIERQSFGNPFTEDELLVWLRNRNVIGMVAECEQVVVGFMVYEFFPKKIRLLDFAVLPDCRRQGVGRLMSDKLYRKLAGTKRSRCELFICETNLDGQLFWRAMGFEAVDTMRAFFDNGQDAYKMVRRYQPEPANSL